MESEPSGLQREMWSIIDADNVRTVNLTYERAQAKLDEFMNNEPQNSGLTIVTNDVAARRMGLHKTNILQGVNK